MNTNTLPVSELPVQAQAVTIDVESIAPFRNFDPSESYDVANMTAILTVNVPIEQDYRLLLSCSVESGTQASIRTVSSTKDDFDKKKDFVRIKKEEAKDFFGFLEKSGFLSPEASDDQKTEYVCNFFKQVVITIPARTQKLRIKASQKLTPVNGNPREYSLTSFAPFLGFLTAGGQVNLSLVVTFPPSFEASNITIDNPIVEALPGQPTPNDATPATIAQQIGAVKAFAWHWKTDPKVTINYRYQ